MCGRGRSCMHGLFTRLYGYCMQRRISRACIHKAPYGLTPMFKYCKQASSGMVLALACMPCHILLLTFFLILTQSHTLPQTNTNSLPNLHNLIILLCHMYPNILLILTATVRHVSVMYLILLFETLMPSNIRSREIQISCT